MWTGDLLWILSESLTVVSVHWVIGKGTRQPDHRCPAEVPESVSLLAWSYGSSLSRIIASDAGTRHQNAGDCIAPWMNEFGSDSSHLRVGPHAESEQN